MSINHCEHAVPRLPKSTSIIPLSCCLQRPRQHFGLHWTDSPSGDVCATYLTRRWTRLDSVVSTLVGANNCCLQRPTSNELSAYLINTARYQTPSPANNASGPVSVAVLMKVISSPAQFAEKSSVPSKFSVNWPEISSKWRWIQNLWLVWQSVGIGDWTTRWTTFVKVSITQTKETDESLKCLKIHHTDHSTYDVLRTQGDTSTTKHMLL